MAGEANLYDALDDLLAAEAAAIPSAGDPDDAATWPEGEAARLADVHADQALLSAHREHTHGTRAAGDLPVCAACGEPRPCSTMRAMRDRYGLAPSEYRGDL